ncbi:MAG: RidA family protein [Chloroflexota bacterium]
MSIEEKLRSMGLTLPPAVAPVANYVPAVQSGNLVFSSGQVPMQDGTLVSRGQLGADVSESEGYAAARTAALNCLAAIKGVTGTLDRIVRVVKVTGYVNSASGFTDQPKIVNGASDLLVEIFEDAGKHARVAIGAFGLPLGASVEVDVVVEVRD